MPLPIPGSPQQPQVTAQPYYVRAPQDWAVQQERQRHAQALYVVGEWALYVLLWHVVDWEAGLVGRCVTCFGGSDKESRIAAVYNQPTKSKCPDCFGTTFEGGYRALIVRPTLFADTDDDEKLDRRGSVHPDDVTIETTWDFRIMRGDYVIRADNTRWQLSAPQRTTLRTGFGEPDQTETSISYGNIRAMYEEPTTVVYTIPPTDHATIHTTLTAPMRFPGDFSSIEDIRGPLIPSKGDPRGLELDYPVDDMYPLVDMYPGES